MTELARKLPDTNTILRYLLDDVPHLSAFLFSLYVYYLYDIIFMIK